MSHNVTSFRKITKNKALDVVGTKISVENSQLLISTGVPAFDVVVGGGVAVGTTLLVEEDPSGSYGRLLGRFFLAEGLAIGHPLFVACQDTDPTLLVQALPPPISIIETSAQQNFLTDEQLKIAWRYQNIPCSGTSAPSTLNQFGHHFDLNSTVKREMVNSAQVTYWHGDSEKTSVEENILPALYTQLLTSVRNCIEEGQFWVTATLPPDAKRSVLRISLLSLGSPLWSNSSRHHLPVFMYALRSLLRSAYAVCLVSMPSYLLSEDDRVRCRHLSDYCVMPDPALAVDGKVPPLLQGHDGVFRILKLPVINTLEPFKPETFDLGFKVKRKKFTIEKLQLPPEMTESSEREQDDNAFQTVAKGCGSASSKCLEF